MCETSCMTRMSEIHLELLNEMTPAGRALVEMLCLRIQEQDQIIAPQQKRIEELEQFLAATVERQTSAATCGQGEAEIQTQTRRSGRACQANS